MDRGALIVHNKEGVRIMTNQFEHDEIDDGSAEGGGTSTGSGVQKKSKVPSLGLLYLVILIAIGVILSMV
jgi:hypothetical protein